MTEVIALTCGLCETEMDKEEIPMHSCTRDYNHIIITDNGKVFPRTSEGKNPSCVVSTDENSPTPTDSSMILESDSGNFSQEESVSESSIHIEEALINEVQNRPILWDHRLPISKRGKTAVAAQWEQVSKSLKGQLSATEAAKKWRNLKDCFMRCLNEEKKTKVNGPGAIKRRKWRWYDMMSFYKGVQSVKGTTSNVPSASPEDESYSPAHKHMKQKNRSGNSDILMEKIATALQERIAPPVVPPHIVQSVINKPTDDVGHITEVIASTLRRLPETEKLPFAMHLLKLTIEKEASVRIGQVSHT